MDWESIGKQLLWNMVVEKENEGSGYYKVDVDGYEQRGLPKDSISFGLSFQSWIHPDCYHELTWKELYLEMNGPYSHIIKEKENNEKGKTGGISDNPV